MPSVYKRKPGSRAYRTHVFAASKEFKIPYGTLYNYSKENPIHETGRPGRKPALSEEEENTLMGLLDDIKNLINFQHQEKIGPKELPRDVEEDLRKGRKPRLPTTGKNAYPLIEDTDHPRVDMDLNHMFQEIDKMFKGFMGSQPSLEFHFDTNMPLDGGHEEQKTLREKMLDGEQDKTLEMQPFNQERTQDMNQPLLSFHPFAMFRDFFNPHFGFQNIDRENGPIEDQDLDDAVRKGDHSLDDIFKSDPPSQSRSLLGNFNDSDFIPKHGGEISSAFKYSTIRKKINSDGSIETRASKRDSDGNEEVVVTRSLGQQTHTVVKKKNNKGEEEETENFINMEQDELNKFEEKWNENKKQELHDQMLMPNLNKNWNDYFSSWWKPKL
ncbi:uncharacterized protein LOC130644162 [Hydractinia symbiolongicarpus]|uniref:uncharacterized protein LOC130644162 n=1 Tax=Hydractinia symbiolongicarpus TaxID=13093 RepID=UPI00254C65D6|nr:uncharacterized protein LOC130644162 [Hydractinia symbiolongicarpus]